jgi:transposase InsO family protein
VTDVTEFSVGGQKLYLSPILDLYNGEIVAFKTAKRPLFGMVKAMLRRAFARAWSARQADPSFRSRMAIPHAHRGGSVISDTRISGRTAVHSLCGRSRSDAKTEMKPCPRIQGPGSA